MIGFLHIVMFFAAIYILRAVFVVCAKAVEVRFGGGEE